jgi:hypothetical protein
MATGVEELASVINNLEGLLAFRKKQHDIIEEGEAAMGKLKGPNSERSAKGGGHGGGRMTWQATNAWDAHDKVLTNTTPRAPNGCRPWHSHAAYCPRWQAN